MPHDMNGKVAIVTGGSAGIGLAAARALLDRGASVCITGRKPERLETGVAELGETDRVLGLAGNANELAHRDHVIAATTERFGPIDVLVNGIGINPFYGLMVDVDLDVARKTLDANVITALAWVQAVHASSMAERGGSIVNLSSAGGLIPGPMLGIYSVSKAAMISLTRQLALELAPKVRVNAVAPATVKTRFAAALWEEDEEAATAVYPLGSLGEPRDIGEAIAYLASDDARWTTGQTLLIDGGLLLTTSALTV
jgi:NAD(P)-dependent dehydrogenase (short-subunit alcohol dehydrogenase family)